VVRTIRESLEEKDATSYSAQFRRGADSAKVSIREFLVGWRGQQSVAKEVKFLPAIGVTGAVAYDKFSVVT
jgi:hypothetical protein